MKSLTIGDTEHGPALTLVEGEVNAEELNKDVKEEGWQGDDYEDKDLKKALFVITEDSWTKYNAERKEKPPGAKLYTYVEW